MPFELTQREIAIAQGDDPDDFGAGVYDDVEPGTAEETTETTEETVDEPEETAVEESDADDSDQPGDEADPDSDDDDGSDVDDEPADWVSDDLRELGASYGLTPEKMRSGFRDAGHFLQQARDYDRGQAEKRRQSAGRSSEVQSGAGKSGTDTSAEPADKTNEIPLDPEWYREQGYDDATLALVARLKAQQDALDQINPFLQGMQQRQEQEFIQREEQEYHDALDRMSADRYGRVKDESGNVVQLPEFSLENRRRVYQEAKQFEQAIIDRARAEGRAPQLPSKDVLLRRAELFLFGDQIERELTEKVAREKDAEQEQRLKDAAAQAKRRRPVAGTTKPKRKAKTEPLSEVDEIARIANSPELVKFWKEAQDENG